MIKSGNTNGKSPPTQWAQILEELRKKGLGAQRIGNILQVSARTVNRWRAGAEPRIGEREALSVISRFLEGGGEDELSVRVREEIEKARRLSKNLPWTFDPTLVKSNDPRFPPWYFSLREDHGAGNHAAVWKYGAHFLDLIETLPSPGQEALLNMLALSALWLGKYEEAERGFRKVKDCQSVLVRTWVLNNLGFLKLLLGDFSEAEDFLDQASRLTPSFEMVLYNKLCLKSLQEDEDGCRAALAELKFKYPNYIIAGTSQWQNLRADPQLTWFRNTQTFHNCFAVLSSETSGANS